MLDFTLIVDSVYLITSQQLTYEWWKVYHCLLSCLLKRFRHEVFNDLLKYQPCQRWTLIWNAFDRVWQDVEEVRGIKHLLCELIWFCWKSMEHKYRSISKSRHTEREDSLPPQLNGILARSHWKRNGRQKWSKISLVSSARVQQVLWVYKL